MSTLPFPAELIAMLRAQSATLAEQTAQRMQAELPSYSHIPVEMLIQQNQQTVEYVTIMMQKSDFSLAREYFEQLTDRRILAGVPTTEFLQAMDLMVGVVDEQIQAAYASDPEYRDKALRLFHSGNVFVRNVAGRTQLRQVIERGKPDSR